MNLNGTMFRGMLESACNNLNNRKKEVDALNVFPVPDGDTGTNMSLTMTNGINEARKSGSEQLPVLAKTFSRGLLMGARGNSGVILSQIFRGFYQSVGEQTEMDVKAFSEAMLNGSKLAYKAVMRPVEGTILTVIRESSTAASAYCEEHPECSLLEYMDILCKEAKASLDHTPELLPVLKEARVVDSGGSGLLIVLEGFRAYLLGTPIQSGETVDVKKAEGNGLGQAFLYRAEFILTLSAQNKHLFREDKFRSTLSKIGKNITVIVDEDEVKVGMETMMPGEVLNRGQRYGEFRRMQIDNVQEGLRPSILVEEEKEEVLAQKEFGLITVAAGDGLCNLFKDYRADIVVSGGQTMNPSTEDFVKAIRKLNAKNIFVLPNNSNIIMAAQQAAGVVEDRNVIVLETKSIPQGLAACISYNPDDTLDANKENMSEAISHIKTGQITYAIKDTVVDGREIHKGDYMGLLEKDIVLTDTDRRNAAIELVRMMLDEDSEIITLIRGEDSTDEDMAVIEAFINENYDVDVDVEVGDQPVYSLIIGVE